MTQSNPIPPPPREHSSPPLGKSEQLIQKTYANNIHSSYTEAIEQLDDQFNYEQNRHHFWSDPQQSILYGTPLYAQASDTQKLALNHLYWVFAYTSTAAAEVQTALFNQITASVFDRLGGYDTLYQELELETHQEKSHIHAFHHINQATAKHLLGPKVFDKLLKNRSPASAIPAPVAKQTYSMLRWTAKTMLKGNRQHYSQYLSNLEQKYKFIPAPTSGFGYLGQGWTSQSMLRFIMFNWGGSPFLASQYYNVRMMANMLLKNREHRIFRYYRKLKQQGAFIPAPTAVSYYHLLDESFHTTMSQVIGRDLYKDFPAPTAYEKFVANLSIYLVQYNALQGLNPAIPGLYLRDEPFVMGFIFKLLQQPLFGMSAPEALDWMERCFCHDHDGLIVAGRWHQKLLKEHRHFFEKIDYLWPVNREMRLMSAGGSIHQSLQRNQACFEQLRATEACANDSASLTCV